MCACARGLGRKQLAARVGGGARAPPLSAPPIRLCAPMHRPQLVAHVSANKVILRRWEEGSVREWSAISYPNQARCGRGAGCCRCRR